MVDQLAVPAKDDLLSQFTRGVPLPPKRHGFAHLFRGHPRQPERTRGEGQANAVPGDPRPGSR